MVRRIVQQLRGWITVESGLGEGTTFVLHLPVAEDDAGEVLAAPAAESEQMDTGGLVLLRKHAAEIAVVLSDQDMPEMTGLEPLSEVRSAGGSTPFVLPTGYTLGDLSLQDEVEGELVLLPKPWSMDELHRAVRDAALSRSGTDGPAKV